MLKKAALAFQINYKLNTYLELKQTKNYYLYQRKYYVSKGGWLLKLVIPMHWKNTDEI